MQFDGQVWFSFTNRDVWVFYQFVRALAETGTNVSLEWLPLPNRRERHAAATFVSIADPEDRGRFLHAMLGLVFIEGIAFDEAAVARALTEAGLPAPTLEDADGGLDRLAEAAASLGVVETPALYRHGPVAHIRLNDAALHGDVGTTAEAILAVADSDGIWSITKP